MAAIRATGDRTWLTECVWNREGNSSLFMCGSDILFSFFEEEVLIL